MVEHRYIGVGLSVEWSVDELVQQTCKQNEQTIKLDK